MENGFQIRQYRTEDAAQISYLFQLSVTVLGSYHYTEDQIAAWAARGPTAERVVERNEDGRLTWVVASQTGDIFAYAELEPDGHIDQVYVHPNAAGQGLVSSLYNHLEIQAREIGLEKLYTEASESALPLFLKKGFYLNGKQDFDIEGVSIHNYLMEKELKG